jgi:HSP20 family protein
LCITGKSGREIREIKEVRKMPLIRWQPWIKTREFFPPDLARWLDELREEGWVVPPAMVPATPRLRKLVAEQGFVAPRVDLLEEKEALIARVEVPGIKKEDLAITVEDETLTIKGSFKAAEEVKEKEYYFAERATGGFMRTVPLPARVEAEKVTAVLCDGLLEIRLPKAEEAKGTGKKIPIA